MTYNSKLFIKEQDILISSETQSLLDQAKKTYSQNFDGKTWYGRCIFLSWYCSIADCTFCYRSTPKHQDQHPEGSRRSMGSVLLETLFCKVFNWRIEFLTGGYGMMPTEDLLEFVKNVSAVYGEKIWLNIGVITPSQLEILRPHVKGICASMETLDPELHKQVCPSKPIAPYDKMLSQMTGFKKSIAVIVGMGDTSMQPLFDFIEKHDLDRITLYALKPIKDGPFTKGPTPDEYVSWIARLRIKFPKLEIIAGTNLRRCEETRLLMQAGANAITKFPATKKFGSDLAKKITTMISEEGRNFISNLIVLPEIDWDAEIAALDISEEYKQEMKKALPPYLQRFRNI